ncbi:DUF554 domain-containing protein [Paenibacillus silviterrae]|uniref:DUF554 domain-containing protein n=1 Tax=Paenibacillus silviterrae TaxID=3242194 RepID=UPI0025433FED|nr:DUF554 domain-containing protein [Paenibacillus chinjuensis]
MALWGTIVNALAIIAGGLLGLFLQGMRDRIRQTVMQGIGLALLALGISMTLKSSDFLLIVSSLVLGGLIGELLKVEQGLERLGKLLERGVNAVVPGMKQGGIAAGFVSTTLLYCVGAMAVLGAMDGGLRGNHDILYTKAMLDGFTAIIFASTLGIGVLFSSVPVFLYQGAIALAASLIAALIDQAMLTEMLTQITAVGGVLIMGLGLNVLDIRRIHVANLLPSILIAAAAVPLLNWISG